VGDDPEKTFSACFGAPFMVHHLSVYAELLKSKIQDHEVNTWLLNTGWVGGPYGIGERISIHYTRSLLTAALSGDLMDVEYSPDPYFGFLIPNSCPGVPDHILQPASSWKDPRAYDQKYRELAHLFMINYEKYASGMPREVLEAGPDL
jgi:phosphoenolpyruvate carboxykinase (ATP)